MVMLFLRKRLNVELSTSLSIRLLLAIFTCYRLSRLIARDDGPFFIFKRLRYWVADKAYFEAKEAGMILNINPADNPISDRHFGKWYNLSEGLSCAYCLGVWFSLPLAWFVLKPKKWSDRFMVLMTISGVQAFLWGVVSK